MVSEILKFKRTSAGNKTWEVGKTYRVRHPDDRNVYDVKVVGLSDEFVEVEILHQVVDVGNGKEMLFFGGTIKINSEYSEIGNCSRYGQQEVKLIHKVVNNVSSMECEVDGKRYKTCEEGCPIWVNNEK